MAPRIPTEILINSTLVFHKHTYICIYIYVCVCIFIYYIILYINNHLNLNSLVILYKVGAQCKSIILDSINVCNNLITL